MYLCWDFCEDTNEDTNDDSITESTVPNNSKLVHSGNICIEGSDFVFCKISDICNFVTKNSPLWFNAVGSSTGRQVCEWLVNICIYCMLLPNIGQQIVRVTKHVLWRYILFD